MKLKSLELQGFKSFPDKTVITFDKGVTVIVGPNGSGKSNISDGMRWVLGEMSTKSIRGTKMEDVIFAGSQQRSPMGYAEVSVTFDNSADNDTRIESMSEYDEITVTRRYYRVGDSEYFINRKPVRLRDIHELFMNTGLGKGGYSIIGQGKIAEIISQKNEERRAVFEEAAGISKYRYQKVDAMRKLDATNVNITNLELIEGELASRVGPLSKEAEKARKYLEIYESKKALDISLSLFDIDTAKEKVEEYARQLVLAKADLDSTDETIASLDTQYESTQQAFIDTKSDIEQAVEEIASAKMSIGNIGADIRIAENDNERYREMIKASAEKLEQDRKKAQEAQKEYDAAVIKHTAADKRRAAIRGEINDLNVRLTEGGAEMSDIDKQIAQTEELIAEARTGEVDARVAASVAVTQKESDTQKAHELESDIEAHKSDITMFETKIKSSEDKIAQYDKKAQTIKEKLDELDAGKADIEARAIKLADEKNNIFLEISQRRHRIQNFIRMDELLDGYSSAVRFVVNEHRAGKITVNGKAAGIYGPVSKLISIDDKYATALEIAFGASLQNIVVADEECAKAVIRYLQTKKAGRATFYPITTMKARSLDARDEASRKMKGFIATASELVNCDKLFADVIGSLVGRIIVADNMDNANAIARELGFRYKVVTLDGQVINAGGSFTGGSTSNDSGILSRRSQTEKLTAEVEQLEAQSKKTDDDIAAVNAERDALKKEEGIVLGNAGVIRTMKEAETTQLQIVIANRDAVASSLEKLNEEHDILMARANKASSNAEELDAREQQCREKQITLTALIESLNASRTDAEGESAKLSAEIARMNVELAKEEQALLMTTEIVESAKSRLDDMVETMRRSESEGNEYREKIAENEKRISEIKSNATTAEKQVIELTDKKAELSRESDRLEKKLSEIRRRQTDVSHKRSLVFEEYTKLNTAHDQMQEKQDSLIEFLLTTYELTYSAAAALGYEKIDPEHRQEAAAQQTKYKNIMRSLGNVNVGAIEEYEEVNTRYQTLTAQLTDLRTSRVDLEKIIGELETQMCRDFTATVKEINTHFGRVFNELFGGGHAEIKLTDPQNVLESGIEINVAPPGKIIKSLSLLSGGEQAFVAIALYFAILNVNPAPFCIMDEIESALDEINVDKFADYVKKFSDRTQFVLITHRRGTMESAERLYGVTMHEKGISDVISIDVSEIESKIAAEIN